MKETGKYPDRGTVGKILVIDDEASVRTILKLILERAGHEVYPASTARQAMELVGNNTFDLVITDIIMPDEDGISTILKLRDRHPELPVVAISGGTSLASTDFLEAAKRIGACGTVKKPFEPESLLETVNDCIA